MSRAGSSWGRFVASPVAVIAAYAATVLIWGTTWLGIKVSLASVPPLAGAGFRFILASLALYVMGALFRMDSRRSNPPWHLIAVLATTMFGVNYALTYLAETHLASGLVAVLFGTLPLFVFVFARLMINEPVSRLAVVGALLALAGVAIISLVGDVRGGIFYIACALIASASSAYANVYLKRYAEYEPLATLAPAMLVAGVGLTVGGLATEHVDALRATAPGSLAAIAYLALGGSALAFYLNHWLLQRVSAGVMGLSALMIPVIAVVVGTLAGGEVFSVRDFAGAAVVIAGVWLSLGAPLARRTSRRVAPRLTAPEGGRTESGVRAFTATSVASGD